MARSLARAFFGEQVRAVDGLFRGRLDGVETVISAADGHLLGLAEPERYNPTWRQWRVEDLPITPAWRDWKVEELDRLPPRNPADFPFQLQPREEPQLRLVDRILLPATTVVNACDAGREGELIFDEIARWCGLYERKIKILRLWVNDTTNAGLRDAWAQRRPHDDTRLRVLRVQAKTRAECDWLWGINLTRYASLALAGEAGLRSRCVSVGRVRSPVLALVADRCREVHMHQREPFFQAHVHFDHGQRQFCEAKLLAPPEEQFGVRDSDWKSLGQLDERIRYIRSHGGEPWEVVEGNNKKQFEFPPSPFDLTDLQRTANRLLKWSARRTSRVAQSLYAKYGAITYPRTDSNKLPNSMQEHVLDQWWDYWRKWLPARYPEQVKLLPDWEPEADNNFAEKVEDHHAIIPTGVEPPHFKPGTGETTEESQLHNLIVRRFITAFLPPAQIFASSRSYKLPYVGGENLRALVKAAPVIEPAWLMFEEKVGTTRGFEQKLSARLKEPILPPTGPTAMLHHVHSARMFTSPPELFSYDMLLHAMQKSVLGTVATRSEIIADLLELGLIMETNWNRLVITEEGERIVTLLRAHGGHELLDSKLTSAWETQLDRIGKPAEKGRTRLSLLVDVVRQVRALGLQLTAPALVEDVVFCPATGLSVEAHEEHWVFAGWNAIKCLRVFCGRAMRASEYRDVLGAGTKGAGPYQGFVSQRTHTEFFAWLRFDKKEQRFRFVFKQRSG